MELPLYLVILTMHILSMHSVILIHHILFRTLIQDRIHLLIPILVLILLGIQTLALILPAQRTRLTGFIILPHPEISLMCLGPGGHFFITIHQVVEMLNRYLDIQTRLHILPVMQYQRLTHLVILTLLHILLVIRVMSVIQAHLVMRLIRGIHMLRDQIHRLQAQQVLQ
jgi:hypothetical protein